MKDSLLPARGSDLKFGDFTTGDSVGWALYYSGPVGHAGVVIFCKLKISYLDLKS